jgi:hypothetical protein
MWGQKRQAETMFATPHFSSPARRTIDGNDRVNYLGNVWETVNRAFLSVPGHHVQQRLAAMQAVFVGG